MSMDVFQTRPGKHFQRVSNPEQDIVHGRVLPDGLHLVLNTGNASWELHLAFYWKWGTGRIQSSFKGVQVPWQQFTNRTQVDEWTQQFIITESSSSDQGDASAPGCSSVGSLPATRADGHMLDLVCPSAVLKLSLFVALWQYCVSCCDILSFDIVCFFIFGFGLCFVRQ